MKLFKMNTHYDGVVSAQEAIWNLGFVVIGQGYNSQGKAIEVGGKVRAGGSGIERVCNFGSRWSIINRGGEWGEWLEWEFWICTGAADDEGSGQCKNLTVGLT